MKMVTMNRREFIEFMGKSSAGLALSGAFAGCSSLLGENGSDLAFTPLDFTREDKVSLVSGLDHRVLIDWGTPINAQGESFGFNNDYVAYFPLSKDEAILWVNHEYVDPTFLSGWKPGQKRLKKDVDEEMKAVGGSLIHLRRSEDKGWALVANSEYNRRLSAFTKIPFNGGHKIMGSNVAMGTLSNCAGGVTPWNTVLTAEENYHDYYGEVNYTPAGERAYSIPRSETMGWSEFYDNPPEHYGWITEVNPKTGEAKKHVNLGRFAHECATCTKSKDGRVVVYSGDDKADECLYKFISSSGDNLDAGVLYVADTTAGRWLPLDIKKDPALKKRFKSQLQLLIQTRVAAKMVGGSPLDRPEDVEVHPETGDVYVTTTNNIGKGRPYGAILKIEEEGGDAASLTFKATAFLSGGPESDFSCPDNLAFDRKGNLWMTTDISEKALGRGPYEKFGSNGLYYIPFSGPGAGKAHRVASAPIDAEFTGPCFSEDGRTLFLAVQHPGASSPSKEQLTSHWPHGDGSLPRSAVITIEGPLLEKLVL